MSEKHAAAQVLLVEDEAVLRGIVRRALTESGMGVEEAGDGVAAWERAQRDPPLDLLITDSRMPHMGGRELIRRVRERFPTLPVIHLTGSHSDEASTGFPGDVATLTKPFKMDQLVCLARAILARHTMK